MKKSLLIIVLIFNFNCFSQAEKREIEMIYKRTKESPIGPGLDKTPLKLDISVTFDSSIGILEVKTITNLHGSTQIYSAEGILEKSAPSINTQFYINNTKKLHFIVLNGDSWKGEGKFYY